MSLLPGAGTSLPQAGLHTHSAHNSSSFSAQPQGLPVLASNREEQRCLKVLEWGVREPVDKLLQAPL